MTLARTLVESAYMRSAANDPGKLATDGELLQLADRLYQLFCAIKAVSAPESWVSRVALAGLNGGQTALPADVIDIRRVQTSAGAKVTVFPLEEIDKGWHLAPAVYRQGGVLVTRGLAGDPVNGDVLTMFLLDAPASLATLDTVLDARYPRRFEELIIVEMAMYLSTKDPDRNANEFEKLKNYRDNMRAAFFELCGLSMTALTTPHGGVIIQRINEAVGAMGGGK